MKNISLFGVSMPAAGTARALHVVTTWPAHAAAARASIGTAAQANRVTAAVTDASVDGGFI
jgi:hypothetical protein